MQFLSFSQHFFVCLFFFLASWFSFRLTRIFQDDNHFFFFFFLFIVLFIFFLFLVLMVCLLRATMHAIDSLPNWSIFSHVKIVLKGWSFGPKLFISFLSKERIMAQKCSREMGNFLSTCPKAPIKAILEYHDLRVLCFWSLKGFSQAWSCSKSWCIPNYQLSVSFKNLSFFVAWFSKNSRNNFLNQKFCGHMPEQAWSIWFSKMCS